MLLLFLAGSLPPSWASSPFEKVEFQTQYRQILRAYALGKLEDALNALVELESVAVGDGDADAVERVWQAEAGVLQNVFNMDPSAILPIILFHEQTLDIYGERKLFESGIYSFMMLLNLVSFYIESVDSKEGRLTAVLLLTNLAYHSPQPDASITLFHRALSLEPTHEAPLLGLAKHFEVRGDYKKARTYLRHLIEAHEESAEGKLRLAVNLARLGERREAKEIFQQLLKSAAPSWVRSLSYQEFARILMEDGELERAALLLEQGVQELPSDFTLLIPLAYLTEKMGRPREWSLAAFMKACTKDCDASPRTTYSSKIGPAQIQLREQLQTHSAAKLEALGRALTLGSSMEGGS